MKFNELQQKMQLQKEKKQGISYTFRSAEMIYDHFKSLKTDWMLNVTDEILNISDRLFIKSVATAILGDEKHTANAFAELSDVPVFSGNRKQMTEPQWTGAVSSYARKYALQALFGIGEEDVDELSDGINQSEQPPAKKREKSTKWRNKVMEGLKVHNVNPDEFAKATGLNTSSTEEQFKKVYMETVANWEVDKQEVK